MTAQRGVGGTSTSRCAADPAVRSPCFRHEAIRGNRISRDKRMKIGRVAAVPIFEANPVIPSVPWSNSHKRWPTTRECPARQIPTPCRSAAGWLTGEPGRATSHRHGLRTGERRHQSDVHGGGNLPGDPRRFQDQMVDRVRLPVRHGWLARPSSRGLRRRPGIRSRRHRCRRLLQPCHCLGPRERWPDRAERLPHFE